LQAGNCKIADAFCPPIGIALALLAVAGSGISISFEGQRTLTKHVPNIYSNRSENTLKSISANGDTARAVPSPQSD
jgi:hypothetical protein